MSSDYITTEVAAELLCYHVKPVVKSVRRLIRGGRLAAGKKMRDWWIHRETVEALRVAVKGKAKTDPTHGS